MTKEPKAEGYLCEGTHTFIWGPDFPDDTLSVGMTAEGYTMHWEIFPYQRTDGYMEMRVRVRKRDIL